jgi:CHRD domain-containing protein
MRRSLLLAAAAAALFVTGLGLGATQATDVKLSARLAARSETPAPKGAAGAAGLFTATLSGRSVVWRLTFSRLTGRALAAHIHLGKPGVAGPVAVPLCGPCVSGAHGKVTVTPKVRAALLAGGAYVNVHTAKNPAGEIRGQVARGTAAATPTSQAGTTTTTTDTTDSGGYGGGYG